MKLGRAFTVDDAALVSSNVTESEAAWGIGATYALAAPVRKTIGGVHQRFTSAQNGNIGHDPETDDGTWWTAEGPTNRWAMFDQRLQAQTTRADSIAVEIQVTGRVDTLYVGNISAQELHVVATDAIDGVVYDQTVGLISTSRITDWARWFREPIRPLTDKGLTDLPSGYSDLSIEVTLSDPGASVACGELVLSHMAEIGGTQWGAGLGNKSYSRVEEDEFGTDFITLRGARRTGDFGVIVDNRALDDVTTLLDACDGRAVLYIGDARYSAMFLYGLLLEWKELVNWPDRTALSMSIQSFVR